MGTTLRILNLTVIALSTKKNTCEQRGRSGKEEEARLWLEQLGQWCSVDCGWDIIVREPELEKAGQQSGFGQAELEMPVTSHRVEEVR